MHFVVHWELKQSPPNALAIENDLRAVLKPYSWAQPLANFFVVNVPSTDQHLQISRSLIAAASKYPTFVNVIVSPLMTGGTYTGRVPPTMWPEVNSRAK